MLRFIIRRLLVTVPMVLVVVSLTWGLIRLAPGNFYSGEKPLPPAIVKNIHRLLHAIEVSAFHESRATKPALDLTRCQTHVLHRVQRPAG